ncbi:MAG: anti-sigma factor antagonist [Firmicutes bacterium]|nr:anti-sigma factor antagonist [Bacillota bacterium]
MTIIHSVHRQSVHVRIKGDLDLKTADALRESLDQLIDRYRDKDLVLDLEDVAFMDSSGLGVILGRYRRLAQQGRRLRLEGVRPAVKVVLELAGIDSIMSISDSADGRPTAPQPQS